MRLAEFKMNLFIFFAGRLRKWAASFERIVNGQSPPVTPVDNSSEVLLAESSRESGAVSGPPAHWARLVATAPPQHWLDLIQQKAPHLLSPTSEEGASLPASEEVGQASLKPETAENSEPLPPRPPRRALEQTKEPSETAARRSWLNRLRFQPPRQPTTGNNPAYVSDQPEVNPPDPSTAAGNLGDAGVEASTSRGEPLEQRGPLEQTPDEGSVQRSVSLERPATSPRNFGKNEPARQHDSMNSASAGLVDARGARAVAAGQEAPRHLSGKSPWRQIVLGWVNHFRRTRSVDLSHVRENKRSRSSPLLSVTETDRDQRSTPSTQLEPSDRITPEATRTRSAAQVFEWNANERDAGAGRAGSDIETERGGTTVERREAGIADDGSKPSYPVAAKNRSSIYEPLFSSDVNPVAANQDAANNFVSVDRTATPLIELWTNSSIKLSGSDWPSLPAAPIFNIADELAAMESEGEVTRRLEQEQRGTLWNA